MRISPALILPLGLLLLGQQPCSTGSDADGDGYSTTEGDCDDTNASVYPGAAEVCDGIDNDCDPATAEACTPPGLMFDAVEHFVHSSGYDNGQVSPPEYDLSDSSTALDYYNVSLEGSLQYVSSVATLTSSQDEDVIEVFLDSAAAASDAYGYGKGTAMGESSYRAQFTLQNPLQVQLSGYIETSKCMDGGDLRPYITLADATGTLLYYGYAPGDLSWTAELPAGTYTFSGYAWSTVSISGGGDAYPCANATAYAFFERLY